MKVRHFILLASVVLLLSLTTELYLSTLETHAGGGDATTNDIDGPPDHPCGNFLGPSVCNIVTYQSSNCPKSNEFRYQVEVYQLWVFSLGVEQRNQIQTYSACYTPQQVPSSNCQNTCN